MSSTGSFATYPSLRDRVAVVTGGASGIGAAIVEAFAANGARVAFLDVQIEMAKELVARLEETGAPAPLFLPCDLTDIAALQDALRTIIEQFGTVDVLVNNAGDDTRHWIEEVTPESWDRGMAVT